MSAAAVELAAVGFSYPDGTRALEDVTFAVAAGESVALLGPNGAGKSTLLLHLNGYLAPTLGEVRIAGETLGKGTLAQARRAVGMVFQDPDDQLFMPTVRDDVAFGPLNLGLSTPEVEARVAAALARVDAAHLAERPPHRLSFGEKRVAAIATVLAMEPEILVLDEPSANLDPRGRRRLIELLRSFEHTKLVATHDLELAVQVCPRAIVLDGGRVVVDGPAVQLLNDEALMLAHGLERPHILRHVHPH
jgi:cobalt/nickel transport system ATP-binding protein